MAMATMIEGAIERMVAEDFVESPLEMLLARSLASSRVQPVLFVSTAGHTTRWKVALGIVSDGLRSYYKQMHEYSRRIQRVLEPVESPSTAIPQGFGKVLAIVYSFHPGIGVSKNGLGDTVLTRASSVRWGIPTRNLSTC